MILALRLIAGVGEGIGFALMAAAVSRVQNPGRVYGIFVVLMLLMSAAIQYSIPWLRSSLGPQLLFAPISAAPACLLLFFWKCPDLAANGQHGQLSTGPFRGRLTGFYFWSGTLATFVVYIAYGGGFAYIERIGVHAGIAADAVARMLGVGHLISVGGALTSTLMTNLRGRAWKILVALVVVGCSTVLMVAGGPSEWGLAADPAIAALWIRDGSFTAVAGMAASGFSVALLLLIPVLRHVSRLGTTAGASAVPATDCGGYGDTQGLPAQLP